MKNINRTARLSICLTCLSVVAGCKVVESTNNPFGYSTDCIRGVVYYKGGSSMAPAYKKDGALYTCDS